MGWSDDYLEHHGILGQKWGVRRFQNTDGTLKPAGRKRYDEDSDYKKSSKSSIPKSSSSEEMPKKTGLSDKQKKAIIAGAAVVGTALAAYGGYKLYQLNKQAKEGLSGEYNNMAKKSFFDANEYAAKAKKYHMEGNFGKERYGADNLGVQAAKIGEEYFNNQSKLTKDLGKQLQAKANSKDFSVKEKVDYLKTKNDALRPQKQLEKAQQQFNAQASANKLASEASSLARSVTMTGPIKTSSKPAQNSTVKVNRTPVSYTPVNKTPIKGSKTFIDASKANDDLVQELLKKNTLRF